MHLAVYIGLNICYFFFGVLLINTIRKEFYRHEKNKIFNIMKEEEVFIPEVREKSNYYLNQILKYERKPPYIFILPGGDLLVKSDELWNYLSCKYRQNIKYLECFLMKSYVPSNYSDRRRLEKDIFSSKRYPYLFIMKGKKNKVFQINEKEEYYDLQSEFRNGDFSILQNISDNIFLYEKKIFLVESFMLWVKRKNKVELYYYEDLRYILLDLKNGKFTDCQKVDKLFETEFFAIPGRKMKKSLTNNYKFLGMNFKKYFSTHYQHLESTCFEIFSCKHMMSTNFEVFLYQIDRKIDLYQSDNKLQMTKLVNNVYKCVKNESEKTNEKLIKIC